MTRKTMTMEDIENRRAYLKDELQALAIAEAELINETSGIKKGDRVRATLGAKQGVEFIVASVEHMKHHNSKGKPWVSGYMIKKDGSPGIVLKHLYYEWEKIEDGVSPERGTSES